MREQEQERERERERAQRQSKRTSARARSRAKMLEKVSKENTSAEACTETPVELLIFKKSVKENEQYVARLQANTRTNSLLGDQQILQTCVLWSLWSCCTANLRIQLMSDHTHSRRHTKTNTYMHKHMN
jgi:ATPase subunit of ABC transporter with duplicated ATPase domains